MLSHVHLVTTLLLYLAFKRHKDTSNTVVLRRLTDETLVLIDNEIQKCSFGFLDNIANVNDRWIMLKKMILHIIDNCAPKKHVKLKSKGLPWLDADTFKLRYYRDKLYHAAIKSKLDDD